MDYRQFWKMVEKIVEAINLLNESLEKVLEKAVKDERL